MGCLPGHDWKMFWIQENYSETQLLFQHLLNFIHRRSILGQTEMDLKLLAYCTRRYDFNDYKRLLPLNLPRAGGEAWPLQSLRTGHLSWWRIKVFSQWRCALIRLGDSKRITRRKKFGRASRGGGLRWLAVHDVRLGVVSHMENPCFCRYDDLSFFFTTNVDPLLHIQLKIIARFPTVKVEDLSLVTFSFILILTQFAVFRAT